MKISYNFTRDGRFKAYLRSDMKDQFSDPYVSVEGPKNFLSRLIWGSFEDRVHRAKEKMSQIEEMIRKDPDVELRDE